MSDETAAPNPRSRAPKPVADPTPADVAVEEPAVAPASSVEPTSSVEPVETHPAVEPHTSSVEPVETHPSSVEPHPSVEPVETHATGEVAPAYATPTSSAAGREVVYVAAPIPPRVRGNRVVGTLLAVLGAVLFAIVFAAVVALVFTLRGAGPSFSTAFSGFLSSSAFWIPVLVFLVAFVLLVLVLNRAGWWAHVLGSLVVALVVYFGTIGLLLLVNQVAFLTPGTANYDFIELAAFPPVVIAGIVAREVSIWIGLAIAARGRRVKARNIADRATFDQEQAEKRAEYERQAQTA